MSNEEVALQMQQSVQEIEQSRARIPLEGAINPKEKNRLLKARPDTERRAMEMIVAARNFPHHVPASLVDDLEARLVYLEHLRNYQSALANTLKVVNDTMFLNLSKTWKSTLDLYSTLSRQTNLEPEILPGLANMTAALALGRRATATPTAEGANGTLPE